MQTGVYGFILVPLTELREWERNYRRGDVGAVKASIARFGFRRPLSVWRDSRVMAGNHTLKALLELFDGRAPLPVGIQADPSGDWMIPCLDVSDLSEEEAMAYAIADNATADMAENDEKALAALLDDIADAEPELLEVLAQMGIGDSSLDTEGEKPDKKDGEDGSPPDDDRVECPECGHRFDPND